jgi:hypothetical protein
METIQELSDQINSLVSSIKEDDMDKKDFLSHKYMLISLHVHTERAKLDAEQMTSSQLMAIKKQYNLYSTIEAMFKKKAHTYTACEIYKIIIEAQRLVNIVNNENT